MQRTQQCVARLLASSTARARRFASAPPQHQTGSVDIAAEEPLFGKHGYKPLPMPSKIHYGNEDHILSSIFLTSTKGMRQPGMRKKVLPKPSKVVAIFGCTGFLGSRVAKRFVTAPEISEVRLCTRYPDDLPADLRKVISLAPEKCTVEETNVLSRPSINKALQGCDAAINAIELVNEDFYNLHHDVYVRGASNIGYQARLVGCDRYLHLSGLDAIFGNDSDYSEFRAKGEDMALAESYFCTVVRAGHLYGEGYRWKGLGRYWYPTVYPNTKLQPVWVNDVAEAAFRILQNPNSVRRVIDLGGPKVMTHMQFAVERAKQYNGPNPFPVPVWLADTIAFFPPFLTAAPSFDRNRICEYEMDQVARTKKQNPHIWTWEDLGMSPASLEVARNREKSGEGF